MKKLILSGICSLLIITFLSACAPQAKPITPATSIPSPTPAVTTTPATVSVPSAQESEWDKVVAAAKKEGMVTAYSFHFVGDIGTGIASAFQRKYGIKLEMASGPGMQLIERIRSEQRAGQAMADLLTSATSITLVAKGEGITQPIGEIPVLKEEGVWFGPPRVDAEGHLLAMGATGYYPMVNSNLVKPQDEPKSWKDLLQPQWKGKIIIAEPSIIPNAPNVYWMLTSKGKLTKDYFVQIGRQEPIIVSTVRDLVAGVARGEGMVAFGASDATAAPLAAGGAPVKALDMAEGVPLDMVSSSVALVRNAPHPNATRLFINWFLSQEGQSVMIKLQPRLSIRKDVPDLRPPTLRIQLKEPLVMDAQDAQEVARIMRDKELSKLIFGK